MATEQDFLNWAVGQGVSVVVLVFVLWRLDGRLQAVQSSLDKLISYLQGQDQAPRG
jgi:hypothetical protein